MNSPLPPAALELNGWSLPHLPFGVPVACSLVAFGVFLAGAPVPSLWIDEGHSWRYATEPLGTMLSSTLGSSNAVEVGYYLLLHFWTRLMGTSELALRLPSIIAMSIAVWATARTAQEALGRHAGLVAGVVLICLPGVTRYAQEARPYAFAVAAIALSTLMLYRGITRDERRWWAGYGSALVVVGYAHVLSLLVVAGQLCGLLLLDRTKWRAYALATGIAMAVVAPLALLGFAQRGQIAWIPPIQFDWLWSGLSVITGSIAVTALLAVVVLASSGDRKLVKFSLPIALATPTLLWLIGHLTPLYLARYLLGATPGIALVAAASTSALPRLRLVALAAILVALTLPQQLALRGPAAHNQDYRSAAALVATDCAAGIQYDGTSRDAMLYYLANQPCAPIETHAGAHLWSVQASGPLASIPGFRLVRSESFGMALVGYWART